MKVQANKKHIICAGEVLFDMISLDRANSVGESTGFKKRIGGSPFNICCGLAKLGEDCSFFTQIADDSFGKAILSYLNKTGIDIKNTFVSEGMNTSLAFVALDENGKADYEFYRTNTADVSISQDKVDLVDFENCSIFHFGSLSIVDEPGANTYLKLFEKALGTDCLTSFDPNVRQFYIKDPKSYALKVMRIIELVDILKLSDEDLFYITKEAEPQKAVKLLPPNDNRLDFITLGDRGCMIHKNGYSKFIKGYKVEVVDTIGCGDSFMAGILKIINNKGFLNGELDSFDLMFEAASFAVAASAIVASREGAAESVPSKSEVYAFIKEDRPEK